MTRKWLFAAEYIFCSLLFCLIFLLPTVKTASTPAAAPSETPSPIPKNGITVVVDAGHGGFDGGAVGTDTGVEEAGLNLEVALLVERALLASGFDVIMTRRDDDALASDKNADMAARGRVIRDPIADLVVSIHMNKFSDRSVKGPMAFYMKGSAQGETFAKCLIDAVCDAVDHPRRLANPGDYYMVRECSVPAAIVECGFLSNASEEVLLQSAEYQENLAEGIVQGIRDYVEKNLLSTP